MAPAAVSTGNVIRMSRLVTKKFQVKMGMRKKVMPGARIVEMVATMLTPVITPEAPSRAMPMIQRSPPRPGVRTSLVSGE